MPYFMSMGKLPKKRHIQFRRPDGAMYSEEVFGTEGFSGSTSTMYHIHPPTQVIGWKKLYSTKVEYVEQDTLRQQHVLTQNVKTKGDPVTGRVVLLGNDDVEMSVCQPESQLEYHYKNGQGDELIFMHYGSGTLYTMFGTLKFGVKDYIVMPKGVIYKIVFDERPDDGSDNDAFGGYTKAQMPLGKFVCFESCNASHIAPPASYKAKKTGQFLEHAPFCERDFRVPFEDADHPLAYDEKGEFEVRIKARNTIHSYVYPYHPLEVVGWDGCYFPYCFNIADFAPITGQLHMPPPIHLNFEAHNFLVCSFCPRALDSHPDAIVVPYNHSNIDSDEIMYYVEGNYKARRGISSGSISLHPQGLAHGPHPGTVEASLGKKWTDELAVMCDTFRPMFPTKACMDLDDAAYPESWRQDHFAPGEIRDADAEETSSDDNPINTWD